MGRPNELVDELLAMAQRDDDMRDLYIAGDGPFDESVDLENTARLQEIVAQNGWPTISKVGSEASNAAWRIAQHSPDPDFMDYCLSLMLAAPEGDVDPIHIALLTDRTLTIKGQPQIYGTQYFGAGDQTRPFPIRNEAEAERLRAEIGMDTLADNLRRIIEHYG